MTSSKPQELRLRTKNFALRVVKLVRALPRTDEARVIGRQLLRAATSVAANYRAVCRARSRADFISKSGVVLEEVDEAAFWLELLVDAAIVPKNRLTLLTTEADDLTRIFFASVQTARKNSPASRRNDKSPPITQS